MCTCAHTRTHMRADAHMHTCTHTKRIRLSGKCCKVICSDTDFWREELGTLPGPPTPSPVLILGLYLGSAAGCCACSPGQPCSEESPRSCPHFPQPILPKLLSLDMTISEENTHLGSSCLATLAKSSPSNPVEAGMERRRGKLRENMKPVQDGIWVECQSTTPNLWKHASRVAIEISTGLCASF